MKQKITIARLKELLFGKGQRKKWQKSKDKKANAGKDVAPEPDANEGAEVSSAANDDSLGDNPTPEDVDLASEDSITSGQTDRNPHTAYQYAVEHRVTIEDLEPGQPCPQECGGKLYQFRPSTIIRIKGNPMGCAHCYIIEKLRCSLCGEVISAEPPKDMEEDKYDASFVAQLSIQKYYMGMPAYRQDCFSLIINGY